MTIPKLTLAKAFDRDSCGPINEYLASEKYDGVRAVLVDGKLYTRNHKLIHAPQWFLDGLPDACIDGELWAGHGKFEKVSAAARRKTPDDDDWKDVVFLAFDMPRVGGTFDDRLKLLKNHEYFKASDGSQDQWGVVKQKTFQSFEQLEAELNNVLSSGGEGLMLRLNSAPYEGGRSRTLLKMKPVNDDEAEVIGYTDGQRRLHGFVGALIVRWKGIQFEIGSGLSDADRAAPPSIGSQVTFQFRGLTSLGTPRHATFLRVRH